MKNEQNCCLFPFDIGSSCLMAQSWQTRMELKNKRSEKSIEDVEKEKKGKRALDYSKANTVFLCFLKKIISDKTFLI